MISTAYMQYYGLSYQMTVNHYSRSSFFAYVGIVDRIARLFFYAGFPEIICELFIMQNCNEEQYPQ